MKRVKSCFNGDVPSELWPDILSYLSLEDLLRFRSVSRLWKSIIGNPSFSSLHFRRCPNNIKNPFLIFSEEHWIRREKRISDRWVLRRSKTYRKASEIEFPKDESTEWKIYSALDGLVVLLANRYIHNQKDSIILWNPSIRKSIYLQPPPSPWIQPSKNTEVRLALLFESSTDDHKVLMIRYLCDFRRTPISAPLFDLFSLKSRSWLRVVDSNHSVTEGIKFSYNSASIGGSSYWIGSNQDGVIKRSLISFQLRANMFSSMPLPMEANQIWRELKLIVLPESTLGLLKQEFFGLVTIWAMERSICASAFDGSETSKHCWTERYKIQPEILVHRMCMPETFFVSIHKHNVLLWGRKSLTSYDLDIEELERVIKNNRHTPNYIAPYVESLLLLEHVANPELDFAEPSTCT